MNKYFQFVLICCSSFMMSCSDQLSAIELEKTIHACNAGIEKDRKKCKEAEKAQAENIKKLLDNFIKK